MVCRKSVSEEVEFIHRNLQRPLVLIGLMGSGKSRYGRKLAEILGADFYDTDVIIEQKAGYSVSEIFANDGEDKFREVERKVILELLDKSLCVIASGGGAVCGEGVMEAVKGKALSVWLNPRIETLAARLKNANDRPLLKSGDPETVLEDLLERRKKYYRQADIILDAEEETGPVLSAIIKGLYAYLKPCNV